MDITIQPNTLSGTITAIPSKSQAHRLLICAAFADAPTFLHCPETNRDIEATAGCLRALGAKVDRTEAGYAVTPAASIPESTKMECYDSGSTLRFLLPIAGALGVDSIFYLKGRLPERPLSPLWEEMERMGCHLSRPTADTVQCQGKLRPGTYVIDGGISSQFITGLLLALSLVPGESHIQLTGNIESQPYIAMTQMAMELFGKESFGFHISGGSPFHSPGQLIVEGDWSNGAFFLTAKGLGNNITVDNLSPVSSQGDKAISVLLPKLEKNVTISVKDIPDLVPILAVAAACKKGVVFTDIQRLRLKESDRVASVIEMISCLGGQANATDDTLTIHGTGLIGGIVNSRNDHRIAMAAAIAATACTHPVTILGAQCADKSYPSFWREYRRLGGIYELNIR